MDHAANTPSLFAGAFGDFAASDGALHAVQATYDNATPTNTVSVDGTLSGPSPGNNNLSGLLRMGNNGNGAPVADVGELGWNSAGFSGTQQTNVCHNQRLYWSTAGSC